MIFKYNNLNEFYYESDMPNNIISDIQVIDEENFLVTYDESLHSCLINKYRCPGIVPLIKMNFITRKFTDKGLVVFILNELLDISIINQIKKLYRVSILHDNDIFTKITIESKN